MRVIKEFKEFALKGNVIDLATGVIVGTAFNKIVTSLTQDVIMPPIGLLLGRVNFSNLFISLNGQEYATLQDARAEGAPTINYGLFLNNVLDFVIVAFAVFLLVKQINRLRRKEEPKVTTRECPYCVSKVPLKAIRCPQCTSSLEAI